ncbi:uncharacterized protein LOC107270863 isoform X3 [Cephus cinctus]|uniref:Uncharacterized protein LOC107270863 isoform X3 n=1 Tax=Cephus cinctus TaxID=211228 RepID=A0AAJ7C4P3_CEPCN|nr:uncharacterized protein LOC107270863 isoform X3 [Cephus cinctus]
MCRPHLVRIGERCIYIKTSGTYSKPFRIVYENAGAGGGAAGMEDPQTPGSDCNSNPAMDHISQDLVNSDFVQDNVEYQWVIDYGYRDGGLHVHPSVLSSLSASYTRDDLGYYDDLARNLDANLAEVDMESFRTADIHTLLTALPVMCTEPVQHSESNYQRERYASISGSVMEKLDFDSSISPHTSSQGEDSACSTTDTMSICKSSLLFSPVKETPVLPPGGSYSVDSLDCEDMLLTCQANNKNNYTIAFEGSITMYSDGSQDFENQDKPKMYEVPESYYDDRKFELRNILDLSMARSDSKIYTTWSNLKRSSMNNAMMTRHPSGNNNTIPNFLQATGNVTHNLSKKSQSLPDLTKTGELQHVAVPLNFSVDSAESNNHGTHLQSSGSAMSRSINEESSDSMGNTSTGKKLQNLSLVRLFMKQKSMSAEGMSLTLDQSGSVSDGGWATSGSGSGTNTNTQIQRHNINNTCSHQLLENDFSINWVKGDHLGHVNKESLAEIYEDLPKRSAPILEYEEETESSASVEELSESVSRSESGLDDESGQNVPQKCINAWNGLLEINRPMSKTTGIQAMTEVEDNAVQTSLVYPGPPIQEADHPPLRETIVEKKPVYVVYPNYTLPDLSFLNSKDGKFETVALKPQSFDRARPSWKRPGKSGRPFSCNDIDALKQRGFSHVKDWESLTFLLPTQYKKILHDVPEVSKHIKLGEEIRKPLFCLSPPMQHRTTRTVGEIVQQQQQTNNASSTSSTATQPSSGYRGSSTILTDSSTNQQAVSSNATNPLYLYRYDSISSEASLVCQDTVLQRPSCQPRITCPVLPKRSISLPHGDSNISTSGKVPPRPPLPRSILRKNRVPSSKRYSMFEMGGVEEVEDPQTLEPNKRMSLQEPYYINNDIQLMRYGRIVDSEKDVDEVEERYYAERLREAASRTEYETEFTESSEDVKQLEEFLKRSGFSSQNSDVDADDVDVKLRSYVRKFLALKMNQDIAKTVDMMDSQKKTVSFAVHQRKQYLDNKFQENNASVAVNVMNDEKPITMEPNVTSAELRSAELDDKKEMLRPISKSVELLLKYWHAEPIRNKEGYNDRNECSQICLSNLCPALYAIMSDGLRPQLQSTFGPITNSVWQVVEASSQQGPLTKTLNELVQKINGVDFITEGMLKFHAFIFGLLNLRALDAWFAYLCTRESILRKHYNSNSLFVGALASVNAREVIDNFMNILQPLALCPFQLDLLYQYRQLHNSFGNMTNHAMTAPSLRNNELPKEQHHFEKSELRSTTQSPKKPRPRSCVAYNYVEKQLNTHKADLENVTRKRWSQLPPGSKLFQAIDKLASEDSEDYTDSLEHSPLNRGRQSVPSRTLSPDMKHDNEDEDAIPGELKFRKLQEKWELMGGKDETKEHAVAPTPTSPTRTPTSLGKSKIPRLLTSPIKQQAGNPGSRNTKSPVSSGIPSLKKPTTATTIQTAKVIPRKSGDMRGKDASSRTSRVDQDTVGVTRIHLTRPSSLPYKSPHGVTAKDKNLTSPHRRAASTSLPRPTAASSAKNPPAKAPLKDVRTLTHRLPGDNGHLSFVEGEKLKVILEVDAKWLLCAKGERKGLVPRSCVQPIFT